MGGRKTPPSSPCVCCKLVPHAVVVMLRSCVTHMHADTYTRVDTLIHTRIHRYIHRYMPSCLLFSYVGGLTHLARMPWLWVSGTGVRSRRCWSRRSRKSECNTPVEAHVPRKDRARTRAHHVRLSYTTRFPGSRRSWPSFCRHAGRRRTPCMQKLLLA